MTEHVDAELERLAVAVLEAPDAEKPGAVQRLAAALPASVVVDLIYRLRRGDRIEAIARKATEGWCASSHDPDVRCKNCFRCSLLAALDAEDARRTVEKRFVSRFENPIARPLPPPHRDDMPPTREERVRTEILTLQRAELEGRQAALASGRLVNPYNRDTASTLLNAWEAGHAIGLKERSRT